VRGIHISDRTVIISIIKIIYPIFFNFEKQTFEENLNSYTDEIISEIISNKHIPKINPNK